MIDLLDLNSNLVCVQHFNHIISSSVPSKLYSSTFFFGIIFFTYLVNEFTDTFLLNNFEQLLNVYAPKYDTGGKFWPIVHSSTIFSLVLMHIIAIGMFGIKDLALASSLMVPLPILTLLFNEYCRKRFLPIFESYPVEVCLKL